MVVVVVVMGGPRGMEKGVTGAPSDQVNVKGLSLK